MLLEVKDLDISYGDKLTVTGASLELDKGEIMSIVGESGSGKTTVIRASMGCLPGAGRVRRGAGVRKRLPDERRFPRRFAPQKMRKNLQNRTVSG